MVENGFYINMSVTVRTYYIEPAAGKFFSVRAKEWEIFLVLLVSYLTLPL